jgi:chemotaxis protein CheD
MLHYQLPSGALDRDRAARQPAMFADTGTEYLLARMAAAGAVKRRLKVKLAGGAQMFDDGGVFNIGRRNHAAIRKVLWQHGLLIDGEDVGGSSPATCTWPSPTGR